MDRKTKINKQKFLVKTFIVDQYQGLSALLVSCSKKDYRIVKIDRKGNKAKITYEHIGKS